MRELNAAVQRTIDRIVFLRICEDRGIEPYGRLGLLKDKKNTYAALAEMFKQADARYNSGLFHFQVGDGSEETLDTFTLGLSIDDKVIKNIIKNLYYPDSPYEFSVLSSDILGQVYEQFLGKVIILSGRKAVIEEKPEVKKSGGVYYTPTYIVKNIVSETLSKVLDGKTPLQASGLDARVSKPSPIRIVDPACGSGSFLISAYQYLLDWYLEQYSKDDPLKHAKGKQPKLYQAKGNWRLTIAEKRRILLAHIFGVDIDTQATEVTKLSLLLKVLEHESGDAVASQMDLFKSRVLPDLGKNIKCGNSLISSEFFDEQPPSLFGNEETYRINAFDWTVEFQFLKKNGGFSVVLGNPPWISLTGRFRNDVYSSQEREYLINKYNGNTYMPNMYEYFVAAGLNLLDEGGIFSFIVPDRLGYNDQFINLRRRILEEFCLNSVLYRAPFPNVTVDTLIFSISGKKQAKTGQVSIGEFGKPTNNIAEATLLNDPRHRFLSVGAGIESEIIDHIKKLRHVQPLTKITNTTSGFGGKSAMISRARSSASQRPILKGESIGRYQVVSELFFDFRKENITGRTTDTEKLGYPSKVLLRKTGREIVAAYDDSRRFPEQSLYFTYGEMTEDPFYILGLLNSRLMNFLYFHTAITNRDSIAQVKKVDLDALPVAISGNRSKDDRNISLIAKKAREIHDSYKAMRKSKTDQERALLVRRIKAAEASIEVAVYDLYGLSQEHRQHVGSWDEKVALVD